MQVPRPHWLRPRLPGRFQTKAVIVVLTTLVTVLLLWANENDAGRTRLQPRPSAPDRFDGSLAPGNPGVTSQHAQASDLTDGNQSGPPGLSTGIPTTTGLLGNGTTSPTAEPSPTPSTSPPSDGFFLASSFERPVCGTYYGQHKGCEFGVEGDTTSGPYDARSGSWAVRINRASPDHMGVIADQPLPDGHAFVGAAHRVPALPDGAISADPGYIQLEQLSPTDGSLPGYAVEVRLYPDRRLGLALFGGKKVAQTQWLAPVDQWFYLVVEVSNGAAAVQRMWAYDPADHLVESIQIALQTRQNWAHQNRTAQKIGGTVATTETIYTYADDWYIARSNYGPLHIDANGQPR